MTDLIDKFKKGWLDEDPRVVFAVLAGIATFIILNVLLSKSKKKLLKLKQEAIDSNTVLTGRLRSSYHDRDTKSHNDYRGRYTYQTPDGDEREYVVSLSFPPPDKLELYPKNISATKVFSDYDEREGFGVSANAIAGILVSVLLLFITRYIGS